jgi:hypothetical protein
MASQSAQQRSGVFHFSRKTATKIVEIFYNSNREESNFIKLVYEFDDSDLNRFTAGALENIFMAIQKMENEANTYEENEEFCVVRYGFRQIEIMRLFYAMRNYYLMHDLPNVHFSKSYSDIPLFCDISEDIDECLSCGYMSSEPEFFHYSNSDYPNVPVCSKCFYHNSSRAGPSKAGSSKAEPSRAGPSKAGSSKAEPSKAGADPCEKYNTDYINIYNINEPIGSMPLYINRLN